jgi:hypothetical protein
MSSNWRQKILRQLASKNRPAAWNARAPDSAIGRLRQNWRQLAPEFLADAWGPEARLAFTKK